MSANELALIGLAGSSVGTAVGLPMVWSRSPRTLDVRLLGGAVLLTSAIAALISARLAGLAPASAGIEHTINLLGLCAFPLFVLYTRYAAAAPISRRIAGWLLMPVAVYAGVLIIRVSLGADSRVRFVWLLPVVVSFTAASIATLWSRGQVRHSIVPAEWMVAFVVVLNVAQIVRMQFGHIAPVRALVPIVLSLGFLAVTSFLAWRVVAARASSAAPPRYERSGLDPSAAAELLERIDRTLTAERLFAREDLTLADLAAAVGLTPHQVSEVLNRHASVSFHDLINRRRVEDVKAQLLDPASARYTIEGVGASAGFGSRSALYTAFRRFEGMTPTAFRASRRARADDSL